MVKLVQVWNSVAGLSYASLPTVLADLESEEALHSDDQSVANAAREKRDQKKTEQFTALRQRDEQQQLAEKKKHDENEWRLIAWLASEQYRRAFEELSNDIADLRRVAQSGYDRALAVELNAREALEDVQGRAILLPDGRRVYFTQDGARLYDEDGLQITDESSFGEARRGRERMPKASTHEEYLAVRNNLAKAADEARLRAMTLRRVEELGEGIKSGALSQEELAAARREAQDIIDALPADARDEYERLHAVRKGGQSLSYRAADPAFMVGPNLNADFQQAGSLTASPQTDQAAAEQKPARLPAYRSAPDF